MGRMAVTNSISPTQPTPAPGLGVRGAPREKGRGRKHGDRHPPLFSSSLQGQSPLFRQQGEIKAHRFRYVRTWQRSSDALRCPLCQQTRQDGGGNVQTVVLVGRRLPGSPFSLPDLGLP